MQDKQNLRPAIRDELTKSLAFALRYNGRKRVHSADEVMAQITAEQLIEHLELSGYVVMCRPPLDAHGAPEQLADRIEQALEAKRGE